MAIGSRTVQQVLDIMRVGLGRRNVNDPDSNEATLLRYFNDAYSLTMSDDVKLFEQFGTLSFTIDETVSDGVYTFNDVGATSDFVNVSISAYISLKDPVGSSVSWNQLPVYQDPGEFFAIWGINNEDILIKGYPTGMLYYGTEFTFRTIPNTSYLINIYGYKKNNDVDEADVGGDIPFDYWLRYLAYLTMMNYAQDYRYDEATKASIKQGYQRERKLMLTHTHNQVKQSRPYPKF